MLNIKVFKCIEMKSKREKSGITICLSNEEALVLLNWVVGFNERKNDDFFEDQAEERVLWDMEAILEKVITEMFEGDYTAILADARNKVRD